VSRDRIVKKKKLEEAMIDRFNDRRKRKGEGKERLAALRHHAVLGGL